MFNSKSMNIVLQMITNMLMHLILSAYIVLFTNFLIDNLIVSQKAGEIKPKVVACFLRKTA